MNRWAGLRFDLPIRVALGVAALSRLPIADAQTLLLADCSTPPTHSVNGLLDAEREDEELAKDMEGILASCFDQNHQWNAGGGAAYYTGNTPPPIPSTPVSGTVCDATVRQCQDDGAKVQQDQALHSLGATALSDMQQTVWGKSYQPDPAVFATFTDSWTCTSTDAATYQADAKDRAAIARNHHLMFEEWTRWEMWTNQTSLECTNANNALIAEKRRNDELAAAKKREQDEEKRRQEEEEKRREQAEAQAQQLQNQAKQQRAQAQAAEAQGQQDLANNTGNATNEVLQGQLHRIAAAADEGAADRKLGKRPVPIPDNSVQATIQAGTRGVQKAVQAALEDLAPQADPDPGDAPDEVDAVIGPEVEVAQFIADLSSFGTWTSGASGQMWVPSPGVVGAGFVPYGSAGHWEYTDLGWAWVSNYPWGWAPFHYGGWVQHQGSWAWVPGSTWGPAWVSWVGGKGHVGWAPLGPGAKEPKSSAFVYVEAGHFIDRDLPAAFVGRAHLAKMRAGCRGLPSPRAVGGYPVAPANAGPPPAAIARWSGRPIVATAVASHAVFPPQGHAGVRLPAGSEADNPFVTRSLTGAAAKQFVSSQPSGAAVTFKPAHVVQPWALRSSGERSAFSPASSSGPPAAAAAARAAPTQEYHPIYRPEVDTYGTPAQTGATVRGGGYRATTAQPIYRTPEPGYRAPEPARYEGHPTSRTSEPTYEHQEPQYEPRERQREPEEEPQQKKKRKTY